MRHTYGLQALFQCDRPVVWTFIRGIIKDMQMRKTALLPAHSALLLSYKQTEQARAKRS